MTIDHDSVPRPGRSLSGPPRPATGLLDRPERAAQTRSAAPSRRHRRPVRARLALPVTLVAVDALALCTATGVANRALDPAVRVAPLLGVAALLPLLLLLNLAGGLYRTRLTLSVLDDQAPPHPPRPRDPPPAHHPDTRPHTHTTPPPP
ncbi:hypothetical protein ACFV9B_16840, partial [Kitasatospora purpeofusca]